MPAAILLGSSENFRLGVRRIERTRWRFWFAYTMSMKSKRMRDLFTYLAHALPSTVSHGLQVTNIAG